MKFAMTPRSLKAVALTLGIVVALQASSARAASLEDLFRLLFTTVRGTVTLTDGTPVQNALVWVDGSGLPDRTDATGRFDCDWVWGFQSRFTVNVRFNNETYSYTFSGSLIRRAGTTNVGILRVGTQLEGYVCFLDNSPVSGATVTLTTFGRLGNTDSSGKFSMAVTSTRFSSVAASVVFAGQTYNITVQNVRPVRGGVTSLGTILRIPNDTPPPGTTISGVLRLADDSAVSAAMVTITGVTGQATTAADGRFSISASNTNFTSVTVNFVAFGEAFSQNVNGITPVPNGITDIGTFRTGTFVIGTVTRPSGAPVNGATVAITGMGTPATTNTTGAFAILLNTAGFSSLNFQITAGSRTASPSVNVASVRGGTTDVGTLTIAGGTGLMRFSSVLDESFLSGLNGEVKALTVFDDGTGAALYVGGSFTQAGGVNAAYIARWDGANWSGVNGGCNGPVHALCVYNDGSGAALYAGGSFTQAGGAPANRVAKWNGASWNSLPTGFSGPVNALCAFDDGSGMALYAGGFFAEFNSIARWNGITWAPLGDGVQRRVWVDPQTIRFDPGEVFALAVFDDGNGSGLFVGGSFNQNGGFIQHNMARWRNGGWDNAAGLSRPDGSGQVNTLATFNSGTGNMLYAGGQVDYAVNNPHPSPVMNIASTSTGNWDDVGGGVGTSLDHYVKALGVFDDGTGPALYIGGYFDALSFNLETANNLARWNGTVLTTLSDNGAIGVNNLVNALHSFNDGNGSALFVGGTFTTAGGRDASYIAKWHRDQD